MIAKLVLAVVVGVVTTLVCILVGSLLASLTVELAVTVGSFLKNYSGLLGILSAIWYFLAGSAYWPRV